LFSITSSFISANVENGMREAKKISPSADHPRSSRNRPRTRTNLVLRFAFCLLDGPLITDCRRIQWYQGRVPNASASRNQRASGTGSRDLI